MSSLLFQQFQQYLDDSNSNIGGELDNCSINFDSTNVLYGNMKKSLGLTKSSKAVLKNLLPTKGLSSLSAVATAVSSQSESKNGEACQNPPSLLSKSSDQSRPFNKVKHSVQTQLRKEICLSAEAENANSSCGNGNPLLMSTMTTNGAGDLLLENDNEGNLWENNFYALSDEKDKYEVNNLSIGKPVTFMLKAADKPYKLNMDKSSKDLNLSYSSPGHIWGMKPVVFVYANPSKAGTHTIVLEETKCRVLGDSSKSKSGRKVIQINVCK